MDNSPNIMEFSVKKKTDAKLILMKIGIIAACYLPFLILLSVFLKLFFVAIPALFAVFTYAAWFFLRFTKIEYEYSIVSGDFSVAAVYNNLQRKTLITAKIKDMSAVVPYKNAGDYAGSSMRSAQKIFYYCSDLENEDLYVCVLQDPKYGRCAVVFNTSKKFVRLMKFYNSQNVIVKDNFLI